MARKRKSKSKAYSFSMKDNYVFYERLNDDTSQSHIWKKIYTTAMSEFSDGLTFFNVVNANTIGNSLISQGYAEQARELNFLNQAFGIQTNGKIHISEYNKYISQINDILKTIDEYKQVSNLLKQNKTQKKIGKEEYNEVISMIDREFYQYFYNYIYKFLSNENNVIYLNNINAFTVKINEIAQRALDKTISKLNTNNNKVKNDNTSVWLEVLNLLRKSEKQFQQLNSVLFQRYNLDTVLNNLYKWDKDRRNSNTKSLKGLSRQIKVKSDFNIKEFNSINKIIEQVASSLSGNYSLSTSGTKKIGGQNTNIQNMTLVSIAGRLGLEGLTDFFTSQVTNESSLNDISSLIENFTNYMNTFKDIFVIYEAVNLDVDEGLAGSYPLSMLPAFLDRIGTKVDGDKLVSVLYNTIPGAIGADQASAVKENISLAMSEAMAGYLFNDWNSIGSSTSRSIHMFNLDGVKIPLSYLLIATGQTILDINANPSSYFDVNFNLPGGILYPEKITPFDDAIGMEGYWDEQRQAAIGGSTFSIRFLEGFKGRIKSLLGRM